MWRNEIVNSVCGEILSRRRRAIADSENGISHEPIFVRSGDLTRLPWILIVPNGIMSILISWAREFGDLGSGGEEQLRTGV